jgi:DNA mismatch repair protein MLH3
MLFPAPGQLRVSRVPECFVQRDNSEVKSRRPSVLRGLVESLVDEMCCVMLETKGGLSLLPKTIADVLNSQACRGQLLGRVTQ